MWAIAISITSVVATGVASYVAYKADKRAQIADTKGAATVVADLGDKIELLANDADLSGSFVAAFIDGEKQHPESRAEIVLLEFDFVQRMKLPDFKLSTDKLTLLSRASNEAATTSAACASRRDEIQTDIESLAALKPSSWADEQISTLQVLPYRLHTLSALCNQAQKSIDAMTPAGQARKVLRGTLGELMAAEEDAARRKSAGFITKLELAPASRTQGPESPKKAPRSSN